MESIESHTLDICEHILIFAQFEGERPQVLLSIFDGVTRGLCSFMFGQCSSIFGEYTVSGYNCFYQSTPSA